MASAHKSVNWPDLRAEYVENQMTTYQSLAAKYPVSASAIEKRSAREGWAADRKKHSEKVVEKLSDRAADNAADQLAQIHKQHLSATKELRQMIASKLKTKNSDGTVMLRPDVSLSDLARCATAYTQLLESDRICLGADELPVNHPRDPFADLSDEELFARLRSTLERHPPKSVQ